MNKKTFGILAILFAAVMWALDAILIKLSYYNANFTETMTIRAITILIVTGIYTLVTNKGSLRLKKDETIAALVSGLVGSTIASFLYLYALQTSTAFAVTFLGHMQPLFVIIMAHIFLSHEKLTKNEKLGFVLMMLAAFLVTTKTVENLTNLQFGAIGDILMLFAAALWAITVILARKYLKNAHAGAVSFYRFTIAAGLMTVYTLFTGKIEVANMYQVIVGITTGIGLIVWYEGAKHVKGAIISALELFGVFCAGILAYVILGETVTWMQAAGMVLLIIGVWFISRNDEPI
jgi:drug/metabolite transporter (DMT)-like permease